MKNVYTFINRTISHTFVPKFDHFPDPLSPKIFIFKKSKNYHFNPTFLIVMPLIKRPKEAIFLSCSRLPLKGPTFLILFQQPCIES
jgi:hypothetical protein